MMRALRLVAISGLGASLLLACGASDSRRKPGPTSDAGTEGGAGGVGSGGGGNGGGGGGEASGGDVGAGGGRPEAGTDASDDAATTPEAGADAAPSGQDLFVSPTGDDSSAGTRAAPLLTIEHAATLALSGDRIVLLPGTFDGTTQPTFGGSPVTIPAGVVVASDEPQAARLVGASGGALSFAGGGGVEGVVFEGFTTAIRAITGRLTLSGVAFPGCGVNGAAIDLSGDADVTLVPGGVTSYVSPTTYRLVQMAETSRLTVQGGTVSGMTSGLGSGGGTINLADDAQATLSGVTFQDNAQEALFATGASSVTLRNVTIQRTVIPALAAIELQGTSTLVFDQSRIIDGYWAGISFIGPASATLTGCEIARNGSWGVITNAPGPATLTVTDCLFEENGRAGIETRANPTALTIADSRFLTGGTYGITGSPGTDLRVRGTRVEGNTRGGVYLLLDAADSADLGTLAEPGGNTLLGVAGGPAVAVASALAASAVGNTWLPNEQGSDAEGRYAAAGAGAVLEDSYPSALPAGANYSVPGVGSTIRLAENP